MNHSEKWAPFVSSDDDPWDLAKVAHLHRRAGFGATRLELLRGVDAGMAASVDRLFKPSAESNDERVISDSLLRGAISQWDSGRLKAWWLQRMLWGTDPLREKMTLFWHGHFATSDRKVQQLSLMAQQNQSLRQNALGGFAVLLQSMVSDPAMLLWLDGDKSRKEKPNENFAREFLELFTLGRGNYTESDIRQAAKAFTGWSVDSSRSREITEAGKFDPLEFDDGEKTFLNQTGKWTSDDIVRITLEQPAAAKFLCRKLYRYLISESADPTDELIEPLAEQFRSSRYSIEHLVGMILRSQHFYSVEVRRQKVSSAVEFSVGLLRSLEIPRRDVNLLALAATCAAQGQDLFYPPNVKGWDGGRRWLNSTTLLARGNWANDVVWGNETLGIRPWDIKGWQSRSRVESDRVITELIELLLQGDVEQESRKKIVQTASDGKADSVRTGLQLLLHCPEIQLS